MRGRRRLTGWRRRSRLTLLVVGHRRRKELELLQVDPCRIVGLPAVRLELGRLWPHGQVHVEDAALLLVVVVVGALADEMLVAHCSLLAPKPRADVTGGAADAPPVRA